MPITTGIDVGSGAVKVVVMDCCDAGTPRLLAKSSARIRRRDIAKVVDDVYGAAVEGAGAPEIDYVATTGDGEEVPFATGHFYGMTTHARGALFLEPSARAVLAETDVINMVSRGIATENILGGVHESMAERYARLLKSLPGAAVIFISGGLAGDIGLLAALQRALDKKRPAGTAPSELSTHEDSIFAGAIGAALWGGFRQAKLAGSPSASAIGAH